MLMKEWDLVPFIPLFEKEGLTEIDDWNDLRFEVSRLSWIKNVTHHQMNLP